MILDGSASDYLEQIRSPFARHAKVHGGKPADGFIDQWIMTNTELGSGRLEAVLAKYADSGSSVIARALRVLLTQAPLIECGHGEVLTPIGTPGREIFFVVSGEVSASHSGGKRQTLSAGDFFGQDALFRLGTHEIEVCAEGPVEVAVISDRQMEVMARQDPLLSQQFVSALQAIHRQRFGSTSDSATAA